MQPSLSWLAVLLLAARPAFAQPGFEPPRLPAVPPALPSVPASAPLAAPAAAAGPLRRASDSLAAALSADATRAKARFPALSLNAFWDGLAIPSQSDAPPIAAPWLALKGRKHAAALGAAANLARSTRAGRRAFDAAKKALDAAAVALPVDVLDLGRNYGEFDYLERRLRLDRKLFASGRKTELAGTLAHELLHVAQHARGLPSSALELEIEAHLQDLELLAELGVKPPENTFARQTYDALRQGPEEFIALIAMAVPGGPFRGVSSFAEILSQLEQDLEAALARRGARAAKLAQAIAADLDRLRTPIGRRTYENFSRRVLALLKARAADARRRA